MEVVLDILKALGIRGQLVAVQFFGFLIAFVVLKTLLFDRVDQALTERAEDEKRRKDAIASSKKQIEVISAKLEARNAEIEKQAYELAQVEVRAGQKRKAEATAAANDAARADLVANRAELQKRYETALGRIAQDVRELTIAITSKAVERDVAGDPRWTAIAEREAQAVMAEWDRTRLKGANA